MKACRPALVALALSVTPAPFGLAACGRAEPRAPAPAARAPRRPVAPAPLLALPLPHDLVLAGRWRDPGAFLGELQAWVGGDLTLELWLRGRIGQPSHPVDLGAPLEFFVLWDGQGDSARPRWALSLALDAEATRAGAPAPPPRADAPPRDVPSPLGLACAETKALGPAALRMVCAASDEELGALLPIAARALPLAPLGSGDLVLTLRTQVLRTLPQPSLDAWVSSWLGTQLGASAMNARFGHEFGGLVQRLAGELRSLADDLDGTSIEVELRSDRQLLDVLAMAPSVQGRSLPARLLLGSGAAGLAPAEFWAAERSSERAGYHWAFEPAPLGALRAHLGELLGAVLDFRGVPDRLEQQARALIEDLPLPRGPLIHAAGRLPSADVRSAGPVWLRELGWRSYAFAGRFEEQEAWVNNLVSAFNDPILGPQFGRLLRSGWGPRWAPQRLERRRPNGGAKLPRGSFTLQVEFAVPPSEAAAEGAPAAPRAAKGPPLLFVLFVPEPGGVKLAWGADERHLVSLLSEPQRAKASATLAGREGLGTLNEQRTLAGGFYSLAALARSSATQAPLLLGAGSLPSSLERAPHRGLSPIVYRLSQNGETSSLSLTAQLGRGTLEDVLFLIAGAAPRW